MTEITELGALLDQAPPPVSVADAEAVARETFGIIGKAKLLSGERDHNFYLQDARGYEFVLKFVHPAEDPAVTLFQSAALLHLTNTQSDLPTPRLIRKRGRTDLDCVWSPPDQPQRRLRMLTYLPGEPLHLRPPSADLRRDLGACLARLDLALAEFSHPADSYRLLWDVQHAGSVRGLLADLPADRRTLPLQALDRFERHAAPVLPSLRAQVIHNDFNPHNILAEGDTIVGIIDFGDMVRAPLVQDLATAAAYQIGTDGPILQNAAEMVAAFHAICPLTEVELSVLVDLIAARLMLTIAISSWRAQRHPDNAAYILRNQPVAWTGLERLTAISRAEAFDTLTKACAQEVTP